MKTVQQNREGFDEHDEPALALLGWISFERHLDRALRTQARMPAASVPSPVATSLAHALLGALAVREALNRAVLAVLSGPQREPAAKAHSDQPFSTRELLR